jgi:hypothetical protein
MERSIEVKRYLPQALFLDSGNGRLEERNNIFVGDDLVECW